MTIIIATTKISPHTETSFIFWVILRAPTGHRPILLRRVYHLMVNRTGARGIVHALVVPGKTPGLSVGLGG